MGCLPEGAQKQVKNKERKEGGKAGRSQKRLYRQVT